jgi:Suppressor of fused protein (SUFU)
VFSIHECSRGVRREDAGPRVGYVARRALLSLGVAEDLLAPDAEALLRHLGRYLGPLDESRSVSERFLRNEGAELSVLCFQADTGTAYTTFGLSRHLLGDVGATTELILAVDDQQYAVEVLRTLGGHLLEQHSTLRPGERHRLPGWSSDSEIEGVMAVEDEGVPPFRNAMPPVGFIRLFPITAAEAAYARENSWEELAVRLLRPDVDLRDLFRPSAV